MFFLHHSYVRDFSTYLASSYPSFSVAPNCAGIPLASTSFLSPKLMNILTSFDMLSNRVIPLQLLGLVRSPFFVEVLLRRCANLYT